MQLNEEKTLRLKEAGEWERARREWEKEKEDLERRSREWQNERERERAADAVRESETTVRTHV